MDYLIEPIGAHFSDAAVTTLAQRFTARAAQGYRLHSVFQVSRPTGCLGSGGGAVSYLAIYVRGP